VSAERQERMLNGKDNGVLGFILDYLLHWGRKLISSKTNSMNWIRHRVKFGMNWWILRKMET
jgi:hypothetical protein